MDKKKIFNEIIEKIKNGEKISELKEEYIKCDNGEPAEYYCVETAERGLIPEDVFLGFVEEDEGVEYRTVPCYKRTSIESCLTPTEGKLLEEFLINVSNILG